MQFIKFERCQRLSIFIWILIILATVISLSRAAWVSLPVASEYYFDCYVGKEEQALIRANSDPEFQRQFFGPFVSSDWGGYQRSAQKWLDGIFLTDDAFDWLVAEAKVYPDHAQAKLVAAVQPSMVSFRSIVFPLFAVPLVYANGCNSHTTHLLTQQTMLLRLLLPILILWVGIVLLSQEHVGRLGRWIILGSLVCASAGDAVVTQAATSFMSEIYAITLFLIYILVFGWAESQRRLWIYLLAATIGVLTILVKFDYLYLVPVFGLMFFWRSRSLFSRYALCFFLCVVTAVTAYGMRNRAYTGDFFISSKDQVVLWMGLSDIAEKHDFVYVSGALSQSVYFSFDQLLTEQRDAILKNGIEPAARNWFKRKVVNLVQEKPGVVLRRVLYKWWLWHKISLTQTYASWGYFGLVFQGVILVTVILSLLLHLSGRVRVNPMVEGLLAVYFLAMLILSLACIEQRFLSHINILGSLIAAHFVAALPWRNWGQRFGKLPARA